METSTNNYIYRLTLVVAIPDNGASNASAIDQVLEAISYTDIFVLHADAQQLEVHDKPRVVVSDEAKQIHKRGKRTSPKSATAAYKRWTAEEKLYVIGLADDGVLHAEIARLVHRSTSSIYNVIWKRDREAGQ
jgi:hypothetical protein